MLHGIAIDGRRVYLAVTDVFRADIAGDGTFEHVMRIVDNLPEAGQHPNRTIGLVQTNTSMSRSEAPVMPCDETSPENATIVRIGPEGKSRQVFAAGLLNTIGFDWHVESGELFGMDHDMIRSATMSSRN